ncbi:MAG: hypothetical protein E7214_00460 [Clostridium sp.]|nr:hypothetical protein [Clostridium sp.]
MKRKYIESVNENEEESIEECCFDGVVIPEGEIITTFDFSGDDDFNIKQNNSKATHPIKNIPLNKVNTSMPDDNKNMRRTYILKGSTIRKLNEIKSFHPNLNILISTIVDNAISYYYDLLINKKEN